MPPDMAASLAADRKARLVAASAALNLDLSEPTLACLMAYLALLQRWNQVYNLSALRDPDAMLSHHLLDCLAVLPALRRHAAAVAKRSLHILDVGSGGGLPGVVLAAAHPEWQVSCVDTVGKKATFVRQVAAELRLPNLRGVHARVEALRRADGQYDVITARAFASLADFTRLSAGVLATQGVWMAMKGKPPTDEQAALPDAVQVFHVEQLQVPGLDAQRCLVWLRAA